MVNVKSNQRAQRYPDLETIYKQCSGPGGLKLSEYLADKMGIKPGKGCSMLALIAAINLAF